MMYAEVMAVGDELTSGERLDTNSQWLSQQLGQIGVPVSYHTTVADDLPALTSAIHIALRRCQLLFISGGLGPTADDLTRDAIAAAAARPLELREDALASIQARFGRRGYQMPPQNRVQAMFPQGSRVIDNPHGTAPGIDLTWADGERTSRLFALPGVPAEMAEMWDASVRPAVIAMAGPGRVIRHRCIKCFGTGESHLESLLPDLIRRGRDPQVGITVHRATITLRVTAAGSDESTCFQRMAPTLETIRACLGELVFGEEGDELQDAVVRLLRASGKTLAVCELGTLGLVSHWLRAAESAADASRPVVVNAPDAVNSTGSVSPVRVGWVVDGSDMLKLLLGADVPQSDERELVRVTAERLRERCATDLALVVGPRPDTTAERPQIVLGLAYDGPTQVVRRSYVGHPDVVLERAAKQALDLVRLHLLHADSQSPDTNSAT
jgi:nicotinamide-nucleotide amidase